MGFPQGASGGFPSGGIDQLTGDVLAGPGAGSVPATANNAPRFGVYNVVAYGADPTGVNDSSTAVTNAQAAIKAARGGTLYFPAGGTYKLSTGIITRTTLADVKYGIDFTGAELAFYGSGVGIQAAMTDPNYWSQPITPALAPIVGGWIDGTSCTSGAIGCQHSISVGSYYDFGIFNFSAGPATTWPTSGAAGCRGLQMINQTDANSVARFTEHTELGPNFAIRGNYINWEIDAATGTNSFGHTKALSVSMSMAVPGQTGLVVRGSSSLGANLYNSVINFIGNCNNNWGKASNPSPVIAISSISGDGTTVSVTTSANHNFVNAQYVNVTGVSVAGYNVSNQQITVTGATTFTYANTASAAATGGSVSTVGDQWIGTMTGTVTSGLSYTSLAFSGGTNVALYEGQTIMLKTSTNTTPQSVTVRGNNVVGATSLLVYQFTASATYTSGSVELVPAAVVVGWPGTGASGWSSGTATDASYVQTTTVNYLMDGNVLGPVNTVPLQVNTAANFTPYGHMETTKFANGLIQNYGTLAFWGEYQGQMSAGSQKIINVANGAAATDAAVLGQVANTWQPQTQGLKAWTFDPLTGFSAQFGGFTAGVLYLFGFNLESTTTLAGNLYYRIGSTMTALGLANSYLGLYNSSGTLIAASADQSTNWETPLYAGNPTTLSAQSGQSLSNLPPGAYYIGMLIGTLSVSPYFYGNTSVPSFMLNAGAALSVGGGFRSASQGSGLSALPATISSTVTGNNEMITVGIS